MLEHDSQWVFFSHIFFSANVNCLIFIHKRYATILAFDVKVERDAQDLADHLGVKVFQADIIYHLFDKFTAYREELKQRKKNEFKSIAVFPCKLKVISIFFILKKNICFLTKKYEWNSRSYLNLFSIHVIPLWWVSWLKRELLEKELPFVCLVKTWVYWHFSFYYNRTKSKGNI